MKRMTLALILSVILLYCSPSQSHRIYARNVTHSIEYPEVYYVHDSLSSGIIQIDSVLSDDSTLAVEQVKSMISNPQKRYQIEGFDYMYDPELHMIRLQKDNDEND